MNTKYTYKDFETRKIRYTRGKFLHWQRGGLLNAWGAVFACHSSIVFVPEYLLTPETRAAIPERPRDGGVDDTKMERD